MSDDVACKYCQSNNVRKYGHYKATQYYFCNECRCKFANIDTIPMMQYPKSQIADALNMYYEGMSLNDIRRNFIQQHNDYVSDATIFNWISRFSELAVKEAKKYQPQLGSVWIADETVLKLDGGQNVWFWDIIDTKTRFLIASHMSTTRTTKDAQALMEQAYLRAGKAPRIIYTDKLAAYLDGIEKTFGGETKHIHGSPFNIQNNTNFIERFQGTIKDRTKVMRGLRTKASAKEFMDGWLVHYNFFRPHMSLRDRTPASVAGMNFPFHNWKEIIEQPFEVTARIPIKTSRIKVVKDHTKRERKPIQSVAILKS